LNTTEPKLHIAAVGASSRLRPAMDEWGYPPGHSKHLLPTGNPNGEVLLGRMVQIGLDDGIRSEIHTNHNNFEAIASHPRIDRSASLVQDEPDNTLGPFLRPLLKTEQQTLGAAGDHYTEAFSWAELLAFHDSSKYPLTFVMGQCVEVDEGLVYDVAGDGRINGFERAERTNSDSLVNIGLYVFEPSRVVLDSLANLGIDRESVQLVRPSAETIATRWIEKGLVGAFILPPFTSFNVNTPDTYNALRQHTAATLGEVAKV